MHIHKIRKDPCLFPYTHTHTLYKENKPLYTLFSFMHIDFLFITNLTRCIFLYNGQIKLSFYWFYLITKLFSGHFLSVYYFSLPQLPVHLPCPVCLPACLCAFLSLLTSVCLHLLGGAIFLPLFFFGENASLLIL